MLHLRVRRHRAMRTIAVALFLVSLVAPPISGWSSPTASKSNATAYATAPAAGAVSDNAISTEYDRQTQASAHEAYGKLPLSFEINQGQTDPQVKFLSRGSGYNLFLTSTEAIFALKRPAAHRARYTSLAEERLAANQTAGTPPTILSMKMLGANRDSEVTGLDELPGKSNYFIGDDPKKWRANIPSYSRAHYRDVYPGVSLIYYGNQRQLEYDYVLAPGADPGVIKLAFEGAQKMSLDKQGDLIIETEGGGEVRQRRPFVYQEINGERQEVSCRYEIKGKYGLGFQVGEYDRSRQLVIDPILIYSTYLGGSAQDYGYGIAVDSAGNAYITGHTYSINFPQVQNTYDFSEAFVVKMNAAGSTLLYSTFLGGGNNEEGFGIAVDSTGSAYVTGRTSSNDFPLQNAYQDHRNGSDEAFLTKFNAAGSALVFSTYLGGGSNDRAYAIALDSSRNIYLTGDTLSTDFPTLNAYQANSNGWYDAFLSKFNAAGSALLYSTYLGGGVVNSGYSEDGGQGIAVGASGQAYITGYTESLDFPTTANGFQRSLGSDDYDVFVAKFNTAASGNASLLYSSYLGGRSDDIGRDIAIDSTGKAYVTGYARSDNFPTKGAYQPTYSGYWDAFVTKLNPAPATCTADATSNCKESLLYSTYLGGSNGEDSGRGIAVDAAGNAYVAGVAYASNFPTKNAFQATKGGSDDAFVAKLNTRLTGAASLVYSSFLGGSSSDVGRAIAIDSTGNAYVTGYTYSSTNFPKKNPYQLNFGGGSIDAFVAKIGEAAIIASLTLTPANVAGCKPATGKITLSAPAPSGGLVVVLSDTLPAASLPPSVTVAAGTTSKTFTISTVPVTTDQTGTVTAKVGAETKSAPFKVRRVGVFSVGLAPNPVVGPNNVTGTVTLECAAPSGGVTVTLSSSNSAVAAPTVSSILIPAGTSSKTFTIRTADVLSTSTATIKATANGITKTKALTVN